jgi:hypothetical protein
MNKLRKLYECIYTLLTGKIRFPYPTQCYSRTGFRRFAYGGEGSRDYIGTWDKRTAIGIAGELRADRFKVALMGRGCRKVHGDQSCIPLRYATHIAIYIRGN